MLKTIKEVVKQTIEAEKLADFTVGKVLSVSPLKIEITNKLVLGVNQLVIAEKLTDRFIYLTEVEDDFNDIKDEDKYRTRKKYALYDGLKVGDNVILIRKAGGQKYFVTDRVGAV